jgi:hypothetical protein
MEAARMDHLAFNVDAHKHAVDHVYRASDLYRHTEELIVEALEIINQSRTLITSIDDVHVKNTPPRWLWPVY